MIGQRYGQCSSTCFKLSQLSQFIFQMFISLFTTFNVHKRLSAPLHVYGKETIRRQKNLSQLSQFILFNSLFYEQHSSGTNVQTQHYLYQHFNDQKGDEEKVFFNKEMTSPPNYSQRYI